jgi:hypothetical protein
MKPGIVDAWRVRLTRWGLRMSLGSIGSEWPQSFVKKMDSGVVGPDFA